MRALAQEPEILLLDEPTAFLDLRHRIDLLSAVRERVDQGGAALIVSHDLVLAASGCDRLALLGQGSLLAVGEPSAVLTPDNLRRAYGIEADVLPGPDGAPIVVPRSMSAKEADS